MGMIILGANLSACFSSVLNQSVASPFSCISGYTVRYAVNTNKGGGGVIAPKLDQEYLVNYWWTYTTPVYVNDSILLLHADMAIIWPSLQEHLRQFAFRSRFMGCKFPVIFLLNECRNISCLKSPLPNMRNIWSISPVSLLLESSTFN